MERDGRKREASSLRGLGNDRGAVGLAWAGLNGLDPFWFGCCFVFWSSGWAIGPGLFELAWCMLLVDAASSRAVCIHEIFVLLERQGYAFS